MQNSKFEREDGSIPEVFMCINSGSGGGVGQELIKLNKQILELEVPRSQYPSDKKKLVRMTIHLIDMRNKQKKEEGFNLLRKLTQDSKEVILVICGGDGTVMWVASELTNFQIDHMKCPIAMLPLGTGNDFSQVLGWGKTVPDDLLDDDFAKLKKRASYWLSAQRSNLDIWMVEAEVQDYGKFQKVENKQPALFQGKSLVKHFCNYFSIGIDGKIGFSFDMHRTSSRMGNLAVYGGLGIVKSIGKTKTLGDLTKSFKQQNLQIVIEKKNSASNRQLITNENGNIIMNRQSRTLEAVKDNENLLFLNIDSFMGGVKDIWKNADLPSHLKGSGFGRQKFGDGKIQVLSFGGAMSLGFQKSVGGMATKVYQGTGPFFYEFNEFPQEGKHRTYLQIDGQFFRYTHPKQVLIQSSNLSKNGKISVLSRVPIERQKGCC